jgi:hypothetical protein
VTLPEENPYEVRGHDAGRAVLLCRRCPAEAGPTIHRYERPVFVQGMDGLKCAIGHLIADDQYSPTMETRNVGYLSNECPDLSWMQRHLPLLEALQWPSEENPRKWLP